MRSYKYFVTVITLANLRLSQASCHVPVNEDHRLLIFILLVCCFFPQFHLHKSPNYFILSNSLYISIGLTIYTFMLKQQQYIGILP